MTAWTQALSAALLHFIWQGSLVSIVLWMALFGMQRRPAAWRYLASCATLAILAVLPPATAWMLALRASRPATAAVGAAYVAPAYFFAASPMNVGAVSWLARVEGWALPVWALGVLLLSIRLVWGARQVRRLRRRVEPVTGTVLEAVARLAQRMGIQQVVGVGLSPRTESPAVVGWIRPLILLPSATLMGLTTEQLEAVLAHELAHIRRFDYAVNLLQMLIETLLFYHPAVWWVSARMRHERELCCDDLAVAACGNAACYARALTRLERMRLSAPQVAIASTGGPLLYRIQRVMGVAGPRYGASRLPAILTLVLGLVCLGWNVRWAKAQDQQEQTAKQDAEQAQQQTQGPARISVNTDGQTVTLTLDNSGKPQKARQQGEFEMDADPGRIATFTYNAQEYAMLDRRNGVQVDTSGAAIVKREPVVYPGPAIERNIQGTVTVEAILDANGEVSDAHVLAGPQELRKAALQSVLGWRFQPDPAGAGASRLVNINFQIPPGGFPREPAGTLLRGPDVGFARKAEAEQTGQTVAFLESEVAALRQKAEEGQLEPGAARELSAKAAEVGLRLEIARQAEQLSREGIVRHGEDSPASAIGRTISHINFRRFSEVEQKEMMAQLPVHIGDVLTAESLDQLEKTIGQVSEHFVIGYSLAEGNRVEIHIGNTQR